MANFMSAWGTKFDPGFQNTPKADTTRIDSRSKRKQFPIPTGNRPLQMHFTCSAPSLSSSIMQHVSFSDGTAHGLWALQLQATSRFAAGDSHKNAVRNGQTCAAVSDNAPIAPRLVSLRLGVPLRGATSSPF